MARVLAIGERISHFFLRDAVFLGIDPATLQMTPPSRSAAEPEPEPDAEAPSRSRSYKKKSKSKSKSKSESTTITTIPSPAVSIQQPISQLSWIGESIKDAHLKDPIAAHAKAKVERCLLHPDSQNEEPTVFRLTSLPPEIREMIYEYIFIVTSGKKPKFLNAVEGNQMLYWEAYKAFCATNNFTISLKQNGNLRLCGNKGVEAFPLEDVKLVKYLTVAIPKDIQSTTPFTSKLTMHAKILELTLSVSTPNSLRVASYTIIPSFQHIHTLTIILRNHQRLADQRRVDRIAHMNSFTDVLAVVDQVVGFKGRKLVDHERGPNAEFRRQNTLGKTRTRQIWTWEARGGGDAKRNDRCFEMNVLKKHVKFD